MRNHPCVAFYVASNESTEVSGTRELIEKLDGTRPWQQESECDGIHDGSPYVQVNPMLHYLDKASPRGSRVNGFNPEYGFTGLPHYTSLQRFLRPEEIWPMDKSVWDYLDGSGFGKVTTVVKALADEYGESKNIKEYGWKTQLLGAMNAKAIWDVWNYNKLEYGDRFCSGTLFWSHASPIPMVKNHMWDWYLVPTAALYHTMHALEPVHVQFDYLKNTVSVYNDRLSPLSGLSVTPGTLHRPGAQGCQGNGPFPQFLLEIHRRLCSRHPDRTLRLRFPKPARDARRHPPVHPSQAQRPRQSLF